MIAAGLQAGCDALLLTPLDGGTSVRSRCSPAWAKRVSGYLIGDVGSPATWTPVRTARDGDELLRLPLSVAAAVQVWSGAKGSTVIFAFQERGSLTLAAFSAAPAGYQPDFLLKGPPSAAR